MKVLFIGGTGTISAAISRRLLEEGHELYLLNRGNRNSVLTGAREIRCDIGDEMDAAARLRDLSFDVVADFTVFRADQADRDYRLFKDKTKQYIFISTASVYQKPLADPRVTESTPLANPFWQYSRDKIACEDFLNRKYREEGFPVTIVRPSHTYDERSVPLGVHGRNGSWQVVKRIIEGKPVLIHGDGTSLWTMTHNSDFARAFTGLMGNIHAIGEAVQITSDEVVTWNQVYETLASAVDRPLKSVHVSSSFLAQAGRDYDFVGSLVGDKANSIIFDNGKLRRLVPGFAALVRMDQGIRATVGNILAHPELQKEDPEFDAFCDRVVSIRERAIAELRESREPR
ncbi:MAG: NAD-dependent epimerase/dehydratase family protein [Treponema sp.]|jgi:nucleoside-diphosphate-sugar epimerase|nr:NAD-dependent epimerase/dehydratase family protein [Treponema sp.]